MMDFFYALGVMNLFSSFHAILFPLASKVPVNPGTVLGFEKSWEHW